MKSILVCEQSNFVQKMRLKWNDKSNRGIHSKSETVKSRYFPYKIAPLISFSGAILQGGNSEFSLNTGDLHCCRCRVYIIPNCNLGEMERRNSLFVAESLIKKEEIWEWVVSTKESCLVNDRRVVGTPIFPQTLCGIIRQQTQEL